MPNAKRVNRGAKQLLNSRARNAGVTLLEMLVSVAILLILMTIIFQITQLVSQAWKKTAQNTSAMQQARVAFERMTRNISQATLNGYYDYMDSSGHFVGTPGYTPPSTAYGRQSQLEFMSGNGPVGWTTFLPASAKAKQITHAIFFQAPLGVTSPGNATSYGNLNSLLNACGYFVIYGQDMFCPGFFSSITNAPRSENRYRLMEYLQPSDYLNIYTTGAINTAGGSIPGWISTGIPDLTQPQTTTISVRPIASNIVALIIMPEVFAQGSTLGAEQNTTYVYSPTSLPPSGLPNYNYDSAYSPGPDTLTSNPQWPTANQLPPLVKVIMVAIDEPSAIKLEAANPGFTASTPPNLIPSTMFQFPTSLYTVGGTEGDLDKLQDILNASNTGGNNPPINKIKLNYYIFQTDVVLRGAKWITQ